MRSCALIECERLARQLHWFVASAALLWLVVIVAAPWLMAHRHALPALILYRVCALVCHQQVERSLSWQGFPLAVCVRCAGLYAGFALGWLCAVSWPASARRWFGAAWLPLAFDWILGATGLWMNTPLSRGLTGLLAGGAAAWFLSSHRQSMAADLTAEGMETDSFGRKFFTWLK